MVTMTKEEIRMIPKMHAQMVKDVERLEELEAKATAIKSSCAGIGSDHVQRSISNMTSIYLDEIADLRKELTKRDEELKLWKSYAEEWIDSLPDKKITDRTMKKILTLRYVKCHSFLVIADVTGYSLRRVHQYDEMGLSYLS